MVGTFTVLDMLLFIAASSVSILLIRLIRPSVPTLHDYLLLTSYCGPAGLAVFGPWAVRRQFLDSGREELEPGEWLWIALGGGWIAATPLLLVTGGKGVIFFAGLVATLVIVPALVALGQTLYRPLRRPWTHWAGIALCLVHSVPVLIESGPTLSMGLDYFVRRIFDFL